MRTATLGDVAEWGSGGTPKRGVSDYFGEGVPWLSIADLNDDIVYDARESLTELGLANSSAKLVPSGTIFVAMYGSIGKLGIAGRNMCTSQAIAFAKPCEDVVDRRYLFHYLLAQRSSLQAAGRGGTQMNIGQSDLKAWPIPVPSIEEQRRIAAILDQADAIRVKRRQIVALLDGLPQEMFRQIFSNHSGELVPLGEVATFFGGASLPQGEAFRGQSDGTLLMRVSDMNTSGNEEQILQCAEWLAGAGNRSVTVDAGAVVIPKRGASIGTNKKRIVTRRTALDPNLMGIQPKLEKVSLRYLYEWFKSFDLRSITSGSTVPQLNKQDLSPLMILVPELDKLRELDSLVVALEGPRTTARSAQADGDALFASLQARAFRGEL